MLCTSCRREPSGVTGRGDRDDLDKRPVGVNDTPPPPPLPRHHHTVATRRSLRPCSARHPGSKGADLIVVSEGPPPSPSPPWAAHQELMLTAGDVATAAEALCCAGEDHSFPGVLLAKSKVGDMAQTELPCAGEGDSLGAKVLTDGKAMAPPEQDVGLQASSSSPASPSSTPGVSGDVTTTLGNSGGAWSQQPVSSRRLHSPVHADIGTTVLAHCSSGDSATLPQRSQVPSASSRRSSVSSLPPSHPRVAA